MQQDSLFGVQGRYINTLTKHPYLVVKHQLRAVHKVGKAIIYQFLPPSTIKNCHICQTASSKVRDTFEL